MKLRKLLIVFGILLFISGCSDFIMICSLNPFYLEKDITLSSEIEGNWMAHEIKSKKDSAENTNSVWEKADTISVWKIYRFAAEEKRRTNSGKDSIIRIPKNFYIVKLARNNPDSARYQYHLTLFKINGVLFGDFCPSEITAIKESRMAKENYFTIHTLARIQLQNKQLIISWLGSEYMKDMIEKKRVRIRYRWVEDAKRLLLTASSKELTDMIERYANEKRFIDWEDQSAMLRLTQTK